MIFWTIATLSALVVAGLLVATLWRAGRDRVPAETSDIDIYRDQLAEIDRDLARGTLSAGDAERARTEVSRRLLEADRKAGGHPAADAAPRRASLIAAALTTAAVAGGAVTLYAVLGAPGYRDLPLARRIALAEERRAERMPQAEAEAEIPDAATAPADAPQQYRELVERLRATVAERPDDLQGWQLLARHEAALDRPAAAQRALQQVIRLKGTEATAEDYVQLADMMVRAAAGYVSPEAEAALTQVLRRDGRNPVARYYSGLMFVQTGRPDLAYRLWRRLLSEGPEEAPWIGAIRAQMPQVAQLAGERYQPPEAAPGPAPAEIEAAGEMSRDARRAMIRGMVERLAARLAEEGGPARDWARLISSLAVLGQADRAAAIAAEARQVFSGDAAALQQIEDAAP